MSFRDCIAECVALPPNTALELTPQSGPKIVAILTVGIDPTTFTI